MEGVLLSLSYDVNQAYYPLLFKYSYTSPIFRFKLIGTYCEVVKIQFNSSCSVLEIWLTAKSTEQAHST